MALLRVFVRPTVQLGKLASMIAGQQFSRAAKPALLSNAGTFRQQQWRTVQQRRAVQESLRHLHASSNAAGE